ncbi:hypothetical protein AVEN_137760-1 [Araneus ventricosus]|uniref:Uncharacterized protein n=1 Tax=Araneus ventricosus TaxID=182803 RepID=A0A4Y2CDQ1_ARAVE|nr:hypothetical protein AVEN_137760-1 [Araneus ventricosus]
MMWSNIRENNYKFSSVSVCITCSTSSVPGRYFIAPFSETESASARYPYLQPDTANLPCCSPPPRKVKQRASRHARRSECNSRDAQMEAVTSPTLQDPHSFREECVSSESLESPRRCRRSQQTRGPTERLVGEAEPPTPQPYTWHS